MFEEQKAVVQKFLDGVRGGDETVWKAYEECMSPSLEWTLIGSTPLSGTYRSLSEYQRAFFEKCWNGDGRPGSTKQGLDAEAGVKPLIVEEVTALEDGRIMVHFRSEGIGKNKVPYKNEYCWIITVENGKIAKLYEFCDTALIEQVFFDKKIVPAELVEGIA